MEKAKRLEENYNQKSRQRAGQETCLHISNVKIALRESFWILEIFFTWSRSTVFIAAFPSDSHLLDCAISITGMLDGYIFGCDSYSICQFVLLLSVSMCVHVSLWPCVCCRRSFHFDQQSRSFGLQSWALFQTCLQLLYTGCQQLNIHPIAAMHTHAHTDQHKTVKTCEIITSVVTNICCTLKKSMIYHCNKSWIMFISYECLASVTI